MKFHILLFAVFLCLILNAQFVEMGGQFGLNVSLNLEVKGKDADGNLYSVGQSGFYKKADDLNEPWVQVFNGNNILNCAISEKSGYPFFLSYYDYIVKSNDGVNWTNVNYGNSGSIFFIKYLENDHFIVSNENKTFISTNGGNSFQEFYPSKTLSIVWDWVNNRYVFTTENGLFFKTTASGNATTLYDGPFHQAATSNFNGYFLAIGISGDIYGTEASAFPYIKKYIVANDSLYSFYPIGGSSPLHPRGLISTKTGRVYCISWSNFGSVLIEDEGENYSNSIPQGGYNSWFMDKKGFLYLNQNAQNAATNETYRKSLYSVRQPTYFVPMMDIYPPTIYKIFDREGYVLRTQNDILLSIDALGIVFQSNDNGESWDSVANIANIQNNRRVKFAYKQSNGTLIAGVGYEIYESIDNGLNWSVNSALSTTFSNGYLKDATYKQNGNYHFYVKQDIVLRSNDNGTSVEIMMTDNHYTPNVGTTKSYQCIEITNQGTILIGGYINNGFVFRSTDNLNNIDTIKPLGQTQQSINDIFQDKNGKIWMATYHGVLYSLDDGQTWTQDNTYPELSAHQFIEDSEGNLICTGLNNTYTLLNNEWTRISYGFLGYNAGFYNLFLDPSSNLIFANGNYKTRTATPQEYTSVKEINKNFSLPFTFYPNPCESDFTIDLNDNEKGFLYIYNSNGQFIKKIELEDNKNKQLIDVTDLNTGLYFLLKSTNSGTVSNVLHVKH